MARVCICCALRAKPKPRSVERDAVPIGLVGTTEFDPILPLASGRTHSLTKPPPSDYQLQVPPSAPGAISHCKPLQQSASVVHAAVEGMQEVAAHINGGVPLALGTQGMLLQQSADDAQAWPEATQVRS